MQKKTILHMPSFGVLAESELSPTARLVGVSLMYYANRKNGLCYPSVATIADACGLKPTAVKRALAELRDDGFISWESTVPKNGNSKVNHYNILFAIWSDNDYMNDYMNDRMGNQSGDRTSNQSGDQSLNGHDPIYPSYLKNPENTYVEQPPPSADVPAKAETTDCPQKEIVALYHEILPELPEIRVWDGQRAKNLASRWKQWKNVKRKDGTPCYYDRESGLDYWRRFFEYIRKSPFLMGETSKWKASLTWIVKAENMTKIIEGTYHNGN